MSSAIINTPIGKIKLTASEKGLSSCSLLNDSLECDPNCTLDPILEDAVLQLSQYFEGQREVFDIPFDLEGTDFQKKVWLSLSDIPYGTTWSYAKFATHLGDLKAIRAVASANGKNPLGIILPCHRVIGSDGSLTGFAWGLDKKQWLLEHEGAQNQLSLF